jgi:hypothetical protein
MSHPEREIRATYNPHTITVYQAYSDEIADSALAHQTFVSPPFSMGRMTWVKPSFLWMMYRSDWGRKDKGQARILAIDITHEGFAWALRHSAPSHPEEGMSEHDWRVLMERSPVRVQWDPERDLDLRPLSHRTIQIGLRGEAVERYVEQWIQKVSDISGLASRICSLVEAGQREKATDLLPVERAYVSSCYIRFRGSGDYLRLVEAVRAFQKAKEGRYTDPDNPVWEKLFTEEQLRAFWWPTEAEMAQWNEFWFSTPLPRRHSVDMPSPGWTFGSMAEAILEGEYDILGVRSLGATDSVLEFIPHAYPFGGTDALRTLTRAYGFEVVGVNDGTGYLAGDPQRPRWTAG